MSDRTRSRIIPGLLYRNAPEAIEWLCRVFGFEKHAVHEGPNNTILHAELTLGGGMVMLGSGGGSSSKYLKQPDELGGFETRSDNIIVEDADAVYARAKEAGAEFIIDIEDKPYGGRGFSCRDLEGRIWNVGTYDPWQRK
ncbi:MAG: glyoxalase [Acidimicrobiia bacterium]|nr:glyoxalase [Acidimicrobiia bacterium]